MIKSHKVNRSRSKYKFLTLVAVGALILPTAVFAAYNDVSLSSPGLITVGGVNLKIGPDAGTIERITVNTSSLEVVMLANSALDITSSDRRTLTFSGLGTTETSSSCDSSQSRYSLGNPAGGSSATITITVDAGVCTGVSGGGVATGVTGGGGGGSPYVASPVATTTGATTTLATTQIAAAVQAVPAPMATPSVSVSGLSITQIEAIISLLQSFNADQSVIDNVRASLAGGTTVSSASTGVGAAKGYVFAKALKTGSNNTDVKKLQLILNSDPDTKITASGAGSPGRETNYYGSLTRKAVEKFQMKYGIAKSGDQGYGTVGPKTRVKLNELAK